MTQNNDKVKKIEENLVLMFSLLEKEEQLNFIYKKLLEIEDKLEELHK